MLSTQSILLGVVELYQVSYWQQWTISKDLCVFTTPSLFLWDYLSGSQANGGSWQLTNLFSSFSSISSALLCTDKFVFRPLSWLSKCQLQIFRLSICQAGFHTSFLVFPPHRHASLAMISCFKTVHANFGHHNLIGYHGTVLVLGFIFVNLSPGR